MDYRREMFKDFKDLKETLDSLFPGLRSDLIHIYTKAAARYIEYPELWAEMMPKELYEKRIEDGLNKAYEVCNNYIEMYQNIKLRMEKKYK